MVSTNVGDIRVILSGVGGVGRRLTRLLNARPGYRLVAAYTRNPELAGQDLGVLSGTETLCVKITTARDEALQVPADVLVVATTSFLKQVEEDLRVGVEHDLDVLTTAEEAAFPWLTDPDLSDELDRLAKNRGVSILGVGLNPGFIFDALLLTASAIAWDVSGIEVRRVVDISRFSATIQRRLGIGFSAEEFLAGTKSGTITGHIGFPQSFSLIAKCFGQKLTRIDKSFEPLVAERPYANPQMKVEVGQTAGFIQHAAGMIEEKRWIYAEFIAHVDPSSIGLTAQDCISIRGHNPINLSINPGCNPQLGSAAMIANVIPRLVEARPGFLTVADLALPFARPTRPL